MMHGAYNVKPHHIFHLLSYVAAPRGYVLRTAYKLLSSSKRKGYQYTKVVCLQTYITLKTEFFCTITQHEVVIFFTDVKGQHIRPVFKVTDLSEPIGCAETSVRNYHWMLRNSPKERSSHPLCGGSKKSRITALYSTSYLTQLHWNDQSNRTEKKNLMYVEEFLSFMYKFTFYFVIFALRAQLLNL